jgi:probable F420-dependent oxidoreductase
MLGLARDRALGAHPYLTPTAHTRQARRTLGPDALLAPEQKVVVHSDPVDARRIAHRCLADPYLGLRNYTNNLRSLGYGDDDLNDGGSEALVDALVAHGDPHDVISRLREHRDAGANHVAVQLLASTDAAPIKTYSRLADILLAPAHV